MWLVSIRTSQKTKLPCVSSRGSLEDWSRVTVSEAERCPVYTFYGSDYFSSMCLLAERNAITLTALLDSSCSAPHSLWEQRLCAACLRAPCAHARVLVQLTSKCAAGRCDGAHASLLSHNSLPCVSLRLSFWCFHSPLVEAELLRYENTALDGDSVTEKGRSLTAWSRRPH